MLWNYRMWKWNWPNIKMLMFFGLMRSRAKNSKLRYIMKLGSRAWLIFGLFPRFLHIVDFIVALQIGQFNEAIFCALVVAYDVGTYLRNVTMEISGEDYIKLVEYIEGKI